MAVRLSGGVAAGADHIVWVSSPDGPVALRTGSSDGRPVAVGPAGAEPASALEALAELVDLAGVEAAGAGVDLGAGFRSARLEGAGGDRRDAILAALPWVDPSRLGDTPGGRAGVLVALFGPGATKPVGAAAGRAIDEGRWAAVHLASAASDLLGPEQVEQVLGWPVTPGTDPVPHGPASVLAQSLAVVLGPVTPVRRLRLLKDLWDAVSADQTATVGFARLRASQSADDLTDDLAARRQAWLDGQLSSALRDHFGHEPTVLEAARYRPDAHDLAEWARDVVRDVQAATALLRTAEAVARTGAVAGLAASREILRYGARLLGPGERREATVGGGHPARPGVYVYRLWHEMSGKPSRGGLLAADLLATARDYGWVTFDAAGEAIRQLFEGGFDPRGSALELWATHEMRGWRGAAGYRRDPASWTQPPLFHDLLGLAPLSTRLAERPAGTPVEVAADLLWYADLGDALAPYFGRERADFWPELWGPTVRPGGRDDDDDPLRQVLTSVPLAVAGAAQLVSIGGQVPERGATWADLVGGLLATEALVEGRTGPFVLPDPFPALDGTELPGVGLRLELAHDSGSLARWATHMGNCIASAHYVAGAQQGRRVLAALIGADGRPVANLELLRTSSGWRLGSLLGRFNADPAPGLLEAVKAWVGDLRGEPGAAPAAVPGFDVRDNRVGGRAGARVGAEPPARDAEPIRPEPPRLLVRRLLDDVAAPLGDLVTAALASPEVRDSLAVVAALVGPGTANPVTDLFRAPDDRLTALIRGAHVRPPGLARLWTATAARPLATAVAALPADTRDRYPALARLSGDDELPRSLRVLVRQPKIAPGRALDVVNARLRATIGRLARAGDPALAASIASEATTPALCALVTAISLCDGIADVVRILPPRKVRVPGYPASALDDPAGPWQQAWPAARELGAPVDEFWDRIAVGGLVVPAAWLAGNDWTVLWRRAAARSRRHPL